LSWSLPLPLAKPCATAAAGSADAGDAEDVESSAGACPHVMRVGRKAAYEKYLCLALVRAEVKKPSHRVSSE
jgi:hypothetical protein